MRNVKPTPIILAFAFLSIITAKGVTTATDLMTRMPAADAELMTLRTTKPIVIDDNALTAALEGDHIETRKLVLTSMEEMNAPKMPMATERSAVRMTKPYQLADATPAPAAASAAAPAAVVNKSDKEITFGVDFGSSEKIFTAAPGATVTVDGCDKGCAATGPWGYSRALKSGDVVETNGASEVTAVAKTMVVAKMAAAPSAPAKKKVAKAGKAKHKTAASKPAKKQAKAYNPYFKGSFASLFTGIVR